MKTAICALAGLACLTVPASADNIRYNLYSPPGTAEAKEMETFFTELSDLTGGELTGQIYPGGQLLSGPATLKGIGDRVVDGGWVGSAFHQGELKSTNVLPDMMFFVGNSLAAAAAAAETSILDCPSCSAEYDAANVVWLGGVGPGAWHLMCREPVTATGDLEGRKIRVSGGAATRLVEAFGAVPVQLPATEIAPAMEGGQIDCAAGLLVWLETYSLKDSVKTVIDYPLGVYAGLGAYVFNKDMIEGFDEAERKALLQAIPHSMVRGTVAQVAVDEVARESSLAAGVEYWTPDEEFVSKVEAFRESEIPELIKAMTERGVEAPETLIEAHRANIEKWEAEVEATGGDLDALETKIRQEIYEKVLP